ncbi:MAG TPA: hypothetical protein VF733_02380 [Candidatus Saccharimonadales bacterium]
MPLVDGFLTPAEAHHIWLPPLPYLVRRHNTIRDYLADFGVGTMGAKGLYTRTDLVMMSREYEGWQENPEMNGRPKWLPEDSRGSNRLILLPPSVLRNALTIIDRPKQ